MSHGGALDRAARALADGSLSRRQVLARAASGMVAGALIARRDTPPLQDRPRRVRGKVLPTWRAVRDGPEGPPHQQALRLPQAEGALRRRVYGPRSRRRPLRRLRAPLLARAAVLAGQVRDQVSGRHRRLRHCVREPEHQCFALRLVLARVRGRPDLRERELRAMPYRLRLSRRGHDVRGLDLCQRYLRDLLRRDRHRVRDRRLDVL